MKIKGFISLGGMNDEQTAEMEIPDDELEGLSDEDKEELIYDYLQAELYQHIDMWYEVLHG